MLLQLFSFSTPCKSCAANDYAFPNPIQQGETYITKGKQQLCDTSDGTASYCLSVTNTATNCYEGASHDSILFHETFNQCHGTGGNTGGFKGRVANSTTQFIPDIKGWEVPSERAYGGDRCARFGAAGNYYNGTVISPEFYANGDVKLIFIAAPFGKDGNTVDVRINGQTVDVYTLKRDAWTTISVTFKAEGKIRITFVPDKRFFLDDVKVIGLRQSANHINSTYLHTKQQKVQRIFNLQGRFLGYDAQQLPSGIYIINGKKVIK